MMWRVTLYRKTGRGSTRYYKIEMSPTLFNGFIVEREYGNVRNRGPTGIRKNCYDSISEAEKFYTGILRQKRRKGYRLIFSKASNSF